ncbi:MAG: hypothetical protein HY868_11835 [Chloroflexi bacterium]|nr:hypothetical protein [Chloroflexota bacterium]
MRLQVFLHAILLVTLTACAAPSTPTATAVPPTATVAVATKPAAQATTPSNASSAASCAMTNAAPLDSFRSDDPKKLDASAKPKLVEFFAYW